MAMAMVLLHFTWGNGPFLGWVFKIFGIYFVAVSKNL